ncbi:MAG: VWA domain-containing protein [Roseivivax sp.]|nr:VWA domain-containing protein [Roseivivax sp.]
MTHLAVAAAITMIAFGGLGIDMMHAELTRAKIQATLDRSVLAAADLDNMLVPGDVVYDYFAKMGVSDALTGVQTTQAANYKIVSAQAATTHDSNFSHILGVDRFDIGGHSKAQEWVNYVEVSLVLDISGSMAKNNRMTNMKNAAQLFVDTVMDENFPDSVSVSLVPYSEHVNAGPLANYLNVNRSHNYADCLEIPDSEYTSAAFDTAATYNQMQYYQWNYYGDNGLSNTVCPSPAYARIAPVNSDAEALKAQIREFQPRAGTSIFMGMKWGTGLLDPSMRAIVNQMAADGVVPNNVVGRPFDTDRRDVGKHIVLMTDGMNDKSFRIQNWAYNQPSMVEHWANNNLWYFNVNNVTDGWNWDDFYTQRYDRWYGNALLDRICDAAKEDGITIWTVAFETDSNGSQVLEQCASSPSHHFDASGAELSDVFYSIARSINQLRLVE